MEFRILGSLEVLEGGRPIRLRGARERAVLAFLLLHAGEVVSTERLIEELWGEELLDTARKSLQVRVAHLRKALGGNAVTSRGPGYLITLEPGQLDLQRFERLVAEADASEPPAAAEKLREALALWRGPPLADFAYETFAQAPIGRLEELRLTALEKRIEADLALGRHADLVSELEALVAEHPRREQLRGQLMLALYRSGRQVEALAIYREARRVLVEELGIEPSPELQQLEKAILNQDALLAAKVRPEPARTNLPARPTSLVGREHELAAACGLLQRDAVRLLTLTGPAGTGKTRLVLEVGAALLDWFADGVFLVPLAPISDPALVVSTIAQTIAAGEQGGEPPLETLKKYLHERQLLLVLDNFEQVLEAAPLLAELLAACSQLSMLVTSRAPLRLSGEHEFPVPPLELPDLNDLPDIGSLCRSSAVALFLERAEAVKPDFRITTSNAAAVAEICARLDGLPLAIELAAAQVRIFAPQELLSRLEQRLQLLTGGARDLPVRQQTLRAAIGWSNDLLRDGEKALFSRLAVFVGGFTLEAAQAVCAGPGATADLLPDLTALVEQSLVQPAQGTDGERRFAMLETIREYALEQLAAGGQTDELYRRHAEHFLALAVQAEQLRPHWPTGRARGVSSSLEPEWGESQAAWLGRLQAEHDNLRAALAWAGQAGEAELQLQMAAGLWRFWFIRGYLDEGRAWLAEALASDRGQAVPLRAKALNGAAFLAHRQGDYDEARVFAEEALPLCRDLGDPRTIARSLNVLALVVSFGGDHERASTLYEESLELFQKLRDKAGISAVSNGLATEALFRGEYERATLLFEQALAPRRELGDKWGIDAFLTNLALASVHQGRHREALAALRQSLALSQELECKEGIHYCLECVAAVAASRGKHTDAARYLGGAEAVREAISSSLLPHFADLHERTIAAVRADLEEDPFAAAWAQGRAMKANEALACAVNALSVLDGDERP